MRPPDGIALLGEALSVVIHAPARLVVATHPHADLVSFWNLDSGFLGTLALPGPRGVAVLGDQRHIVISYSADGRLLLVDADSLRAKPFQDVGSGLFGGAHLYGWDGTANGLATGGEAASFAT